MSSPDNQTREILEVTRENPQLSPKEIAARVGCPRTEVTDVLKRYEDGAAVDRELKRSDMATSQTGWVLPVVLGASGLALIGLSGGADATLPTLLLGIGILSIALWARGWL